MSSPHVGEASLGRPRPRIHFTPGDGWINDPYGIGWVNGRYELYYQAVPGSVTWGPNCHWGHATAPDLVQWSEGPLALAPQDYEVGCWSGSVVHETDPPTIFYTRVAGDDWDLGKVATATLDATTGRWTTRSGDVIVDQPPAHLDVRCFRDPYVFRHGDGWTMLVGAALEGGTAAVLQYHSPDMLTWAYDGILCSRQSDRTDAVWTASMWECPQLFPLGDEWVLLVSVCEAGTLQYVAAAIGGYDGHAFRARTWQRLTYGNCAYAMAAFLDRDGRRCVMSWLREEPQGDEPLAERAGAHSVASTIELDEGGRLVLRPHQDVVALRARALAGHTDGTGTSYEVVDAPVEINAVTRPGLEVTISDDAQSRATLTVGADRDVLVIDRGGYGRETLPLRDSGASVRILLDADILEVFTAGTYGAYRIAPSCSSGTRVVRIDHGGAGSDGQNIVWPLTSR